MPIMLLIVNEVHMTWSRRGPIKTPLMQWKWMNWSQQIWNLPW